MKPAAPQESAALLKISLPLIFAYLSDVAMVVSAKAIIGKLGFLQLASAGISIDIGFQFAIVVMGFFSVVGVLVSSALGAKRREDVLPALAQGMVLAGAVGTVLTLIVFRLDIILQWARQDAEVIAAARPFHQMFALSMLPMIWFSVLRSFAAALMRTSFVLLITVVTVVLNYALMLGIVHGAFGFPAFGIAGAGAAWAFSMWFKFLCLGVFILWLIGREKLVFHGRHLLHGAGNLRPLLHLGLPVAGIVALESALFAAVSLMSGALGPKSLAAYQMMMGWIAIPFVISLGFSEAVMVRVSFWAGAKNLAAARQAGHLGMGIGIAVPAVLIVIPLFFPRLITDVFLSPQDAGYAEISAMVIGVLAIAVLFQMFDGLQAIASHALRGLHDAAMPLLIAAIGYWPIGFGAAYILAFPLGYGFAGLWWGVALGLMFTALLLAWRFEILSRRMG